MSEQAGAATGVHLRLPRVGKKTVRPIDLDLDKLSVRKKRKVAPQSLANLKPAKPGEIRNPLGRTPGSRNGLAESLISALARDFREQGDRAIAACRARNPDRYLAIIASLVPKDITITTLTDGMSRDDMSSAIQLIKALLAQRNALPADADVVGIVLPATDPQP